MSRPDYAVYIGLDVGKQAHHACALNVDGTRLHDKPLPQDESSLRGLLTELGTHGRLLVVVDQPVAGRAASTGQLRR